MKRLKSILLSFIFLLFLASSVVAQNGPVGGSGAEPIAAGGGITINDVIEFPVKLAEDVAISGNGQFLIASTGASPYKVYAYKWNDSSLKFEQVAALPEATINSKPANISISDSGAQIVFPHSSTIYAYNFNLVGNSLKGYRLATHNLSALPSAANFAGYFNKAGTAGSVVPFTAIWHKFVPTF